MRVIWVAGGEVEMSATSWPGTGPEGDKVGEPPSVQGVSRVKGCMLIHILRLLSGAWDRPVRFYNMRSY